MTTEAHSQSQRVSKHTQLLPRLWKHVLPLLSRCNHVSVLPQMCCRRARPCRQTHRHGSAQPPPPSSLLLPPYAANGSCCPQDTTSLHSAHSTKSSHSISSGFFFSPCLFVQPGAAAGLPQLPGAQLGTIDTPMKSLSTSSKLNSTLLVVAAVPGTDGPAGLQKL